MARRGSIGAGAGWLAAVLVLHGVMGLSFALVQVNGVLAGTTITALGTGAGGAWPSNPTARSP